MQQDISCLSRDERWDESCSAHWPPVSSLVFFLQSFRLGPLPTRQNHDGERYVDLLSSPIAVSKCFCSHCSFAVSLWIPWRWSDFLSPCSIAVSLRIPCQWRDFSPLFHCWFACGFHGDEVIIFPLFNCWIACGFRGSEVIIFPLFDNICPSAPLQVAVMHSMDGPQRCAKA